MPEQKRREEGSFWRYRRAVLEPWWHDTLATLKRWLLLEILLTLAGAGGVSVATWYLFDYERAVEAAKAGLIGAGATTVIIVLVVGIWHAIRSAGQAWNSDQLTIGDLKTEREQLKSAVERLEANNHNLAREIEGRAVENRSLEEEAGRLKGANSGLLTQLEALRKLELVPNPEDDDGTISILPVTIEYSDPARPALEATVVWGTLSNITIVNNATHETELLRLWLRVCDDVTGAEIMPLRGDDVLGQPAEEAMPPMEEFHPVGPIAPCSSRKGELKYRAYYPGRFGRKSAAEKAKMISLCARAAGLETAHSPLVESFFSSHETLQARAAERKLRRISRNRAAMFYLNRAHRTLCESLHTTDEAELLRLWADLEDRLQRYQWTFEDLTPQAYAIQEAIYQRLARAVAARALDELDQPLCELTDIFFGGDYDLAVEVSQTHSGILTSAAPRDRFMIVNALVVNRSPAAVSLMPSWCLELHKGHSTTSFDPDAEPNVEWEERRGRARIPKARALPVPLYLPPGQGEVGYWSFFINRNLEYWEPDLYEREEPARHYLEVVDLATGKRTKTDAWTLDVKQLKNEAKGEG